VLNAGLLDVLLGVAGMIVTCDYGSLVTCDDWDHSRKFPAFNTSKNIGRKTRHCGVHVILRRKLSDGDGSKVESPIVFPYIFEMMSIH
jgi:hypothetical protein